MHCASCCRPMLLTGYAQQEPTRILFHSDGLRHWIPAVKERRKAATHCIVKITESLVRSFSLAHATRQFKHFRDEPTFVRIRYEHARVRHADIASDGVDRRLDILSAHRVSPPRP